MNSWGYITSDLIAVASAFYSDIGKIIISGAVGFLLGVCKDNLTKDKRKLLRRTSYCPIGSTTEFRFAVSHVGNSTIENVRMRLTWPFNHAVPYHCFLVDEEVKCDRLSTGPQVGNSISYTWAYINPGDDLELVVRIDNCKDPELVDLEIDGKSTSVARKKLTMRCGC